jgi:hypothetical protein
LHINMRGHWSEGESGTGRKEQCVQRLWGRKESWGSDIKVMWLEFCQRNRANGRTRECRTVQLGHGSRACTATCRSVRVSEQRKNITSLGKTSSLQCGDQVEGFYNHSEGRVGVVWRQWENRHMEEILRNLN